MKTTIIIMLLLLAKCLVGQNYFISRIQSPNTEKSFHSVYMIGNKAFAGGTDFSCYYDGEELIEVLQPNNYTIGRIGGFEKPNGEIYAFQDNFYRFYQWNNDIKNWTMITKPDNLQHKSFSKIFALAENKVYISEIGYDEDYDYGMIHFYDGSQFTLLSRIYGARYEDMYVKTENNILLLASIIPNLVSPKLLRFDGDNLHTLHVFPDDRGTHYSFYTIDGNIFYLLSSKGDIYKWNDSTESIEQLYAYPEAEEYLFAECIFATDNNNLYVAGGGGIRHINISTGVINLIYDLPAENMYSPYICSVAYNNGIAMFVQSSGALYKMIIVSSIDAETEAQLTVYPNPVTDNLIIEFPVFGIYEKTIEIIDINGKVVQKANFSEFKLEIDISGLCNGIYFLRLYCCDGIIVKKFIKNL